ncbi:MAG TPA: hypothetical protein VLS89_08445 [Candidatus Nanopelagicales bacterium]|nr:hypothetical protein [Candidatus Nanopelagicales bacterium]
MPPLPSRWAPGSPPYPAARVALHLATHRGYGVLRDEQGVT